MKKSLLATTYLLAISFSLLASPATEIAFLLDMVRLTDCEFERNGKRYDGQAAFEHMQKKYDHFADDIQSSEDFIRLAGTKSEWSGKPYQIHCPNKPMQYSSQWLTDALVEYRQ